MKALILAGGQGDRLGHLTDHQPKSLVQVCGRELLDYTLSLLDHPKISEVGVVAGYRAPAIIEFLNKKYPHVQTFITPHSDKGSILGMQCASSFLDDDFLLMNADHIYPQRLFAKVMEAAKELSVVCDFDRNLVADDMKISRNKAGTLQTIHKQLEDYDGGYIGMTFCPLQKIQKYLHASETALAKRGEKAAVEMTVAELIAQGETVQIIDTSGIRWLEIDTLEDLRLAEETLQTKSDFLL